MKRLIIILHPIKYIYSNQFVLKNLLVPVKTNLQGRKEVNTVQRKKYLTKSTKIKTLQISCNNCLKTRIQNQRISQIQICQKIILQKTGYHKTTRRIRKKQMQILLMTLRECSKVMIVVKMFQIQMKQILISQQKTVGFRMHACNTRLFQKVRMTRLIK